MKVVIATHNKDKLKELKLGLKDLNIDLLDLSHFPDIKAIIEDGSTLKDNAILKAKFVHRKTGLPAIADDTGLEVDYLGGNPGVFTARYAGENCTYMDNVNKMLKVMKNVDNKDRNATFKTVMAYIDSKKELFSQGIVKGLISKKIKGLAGFGYDCIFYVPEEEKTFAEMTIEKKNIISHRGKAIKSFVPILASYFNNQDNVKESA